VQSQIDLRLVVSSKEDAYGLLRARRSGIPSLILPKKNDWQALQEELNKRKIDFLFLLGFMKLLPADFCRRWQGRIFNVHPSLLPKYPGLQAMEKSHAEKAAMGVTVHVVTAGMDEGPAVYQKPVIKENHFMSFAEAQLKMSFTEQNLVRRLVIDVERAIYE
jgi:folate-dependent phosphoribosylglycinamide formyltransferase PurN